jgi:hypothetical protein
MATGAPYFVQICTVSTSPCPESKTGLVPAYLIDPSYQAQAEIMLNQSGIDWTAVYDSCGMSLLMFAVGSGCGLLVNLIKKVR